MRKGKQQYRCVLYSAAKPNSLLIMRNVDTLWLYESASLCSSHWACNSVCVMFLLCFFVLFFENTKCVFFLLLCY